MYWSRNTLDLSADQVLVDSAPIQCLFYPSLSLFHWVGVWARDREVPVRIMSDVMRWGGGTKEGRSPGCWHNVPGLMRKCPKEGPIPMITYSICKYSRPQHITIPGTLFIRVNKEAFSTRRKCFFLLLFKYCLFPSLFIWRGSRINVCTTVESGVLCTFNFCSLSNTKVCLNL